MKIIEYIKNLFRKEEKGYNTEYKKIGEYEEDKPLIIHNCEFKDCKKKLNLVNGFRCSYCYKYHCEEHRLPEFHKCEYLKLIKNSNIIRRFD